MEVQQCMKLSFTNSSFGLITLITQYSSFKSAIGALKRLVGLRSRLSAPAALSSAGAPNSWRPTFVGFGAACRKRAEHPIEKNRQ